MHFNAMLLNVLFSCYFLGFIQKHSGGVVVKSCVKDFIDWSLWFSRTWKMKMPWAAMATPLSITSSRSGRTCSLVCCSSFFFSPVFFGLFALKSVFVFRAVTQPICPTAAPSGPSAPWVLSPSSLHAAAGMHPEMPKRGDKGRKKRQSI